MIKRVLLLLVLSAVAQSAEMSGPAQVAPNPFAGTAFVLVTHRPGEKTPIGLYTDTACTTPATTAGAVVKGFRDELGTSGLVLTQATTANAPTLQFYQGFPVLRFDGSNDYLSGTAAVPLGAGLNIWTKWRQIGAVHGGGIVSFVSSGGLDFGAGGLYILNNGTPSNTNSPHGCPTVPTTQLWSWTSSTAVTEYVEGLALPSASGATLSGTSATVYLGASYQFGITAYNSIDLEAVVVRTSAPSTTERLAVDAALGARLADTLPLIVTAGDSLTDGVQGSTLVPMGSDYPSQLQKIRENAICINEAVYGSTLAQMSARSDAIDAMMRRASNTLVIHIGSNDVATNMSAATFRTNLITFVAARIAKGWKVYVCTLVKRGDFTGPQETVRTTINSALLADYSFATGLIDFDANAAFSNSADTTYYLADTIHHTAAANAIKAALVNAGVPR